MEDRIVKIAEASKRFNALLPEFEVAIGRNLDGNERSGLVKDIGLVRELAQDLSVDDRKIWEDKFEEVFEMIEGKVSVYAEVTTKKVRIYPVK